MNGSGRRRYPTACRTRHSCTPPDVCGRLENWVGKYEATTQLYVVLALLQLENQFENRKYSHTPAHSPAYRDTETACGASSPPPTEPFLRVHAGVHAEAFRGKEEKRREDTM